MSNSLDSDPRRLTTALVCISPLTNRHKAYDKTNKVGHAHVSKDLGQPDLSFVLHLEDN